jgi:DNA-binding PadR family transcriptional regulator
VKAASDSAIEFMLLGYLRSGPMHGYELHRRLGDPAGPGQVRGLKLSQLYALLAKLEGRGLVEAGIEPQANRPARRVFRLTADGLHTYRAWVRLPVDHARDMRQDFLLKLYFARGEGKPSARRLIAAQRNRCLDWLQASKRIARTLDPGSYRHQVQSFRTGQIEATVRWLDKLSRTMSPHPKRQAAPHPRRTPRRK